MVFCTPKEDPRWSFVSAKGPSVVVMWLLRVRPVVAVFIGWLSYDSRWPRPKLTGRRIEGRRRKCRGQINR